MENTIMINKKIIITGIDGFTGQHAKSHFESCQYEVYGITRRKQHVSNKNIYCDLTDFIQVKETIKKIKPDYILHLAGQNNVEISWTFPIETITANVLSTLHLVEAIRTENLQTKIVITTSALQYDFLSPSPMNHPYGLSKTFQSNLSNAWQKMYNLDIILAKPSNLIGPGISKGICSFIAQKIVEFERNTIENPCIHVSNKLASRNFIDVRDSVRAYELLFKFGLNGYEYEISSTEFQTIETILNQYKTLTSIPFQVTSSKDTIETNVNVEILPILEMGWKPKYTLTDSLHDILHYQRSN